MIEAEMERNWSYIDAREQVMIPKAILKQLKMRPGDKVEFMVENGKAVLTIVEGGHNVFAEYIGIAPLSEANGDAVQWQRELRGWDEFDYREAAE